MDHKRITTFTQRNTLLHLTFYNEEVVSAWDKWMNAVIRDRAEFLMRMWLPSKISHQISLLCVTGNEMERLHVRQNLVPPLLFWSISRALQGNWPVLRKQFFWKTVLLHSTPMLETAQYSLLDHVWYCGLVAVMLSDFITSQEMNDTNQQFWNRQQQQFSYRIIILRGFCTNLYTSWPPLHSSQGSSRPNVIPSEHLSSNWMEINRGS